MPVPVLLIGIGVCVAVVCGGLDVSPAKAQDATAVIVGAEWVNVRRGPGTQFEAFTSLAKDSAVQVQEMQGEWARVVTGSGQVGYIRSTFLALPGEQSPAGLASAVRGASPPEVPASRAALAEQNQALQTEVQRLKEELSAAAGRAQAPAAAGSVAGEMADAEQLRSEIDRLTAAMDTLQQRLDVRDALARSSGAAGLSGEPGSHVVAGEAGLLVLLGALIGWFIGAAYGRRQERGRRSRVRL